MLAMRMMGLVDWLNRSAWFLKSAVMLTLPAIAMALIAKYGNIIPNSQPFLIMLFIFCYCLSVIAMSFLFATFFSKAKIAAFMTGILYFLTYFPYFFLGRDTTYASMKTPEKVTR